MSGREADIRPVTETNHICDVVYPQSVQKFLGEVDRSKWTRHTRCPMCSAHNLSEMFKKNGFAHSSCASCEHQFVNPMPDSSSVAHWYDTSEHQKAFNLLIERVSEQRKDLLYSKRLQQLAEVCEFGSILEIGCGTGGFLRYVREARPATRVYGCDLGAHAVEICRQNGIEAFHSAAEALDYAKYEFDVIALYEVVEHLVDPESVLAAIRASARPGTHLVMSTPNNDGFDFKMLGKTYRGYMPPGHLNLFSKKSMRALLERLGFSQITIRGNGRLDASIVKSYYENNRHNPDPFWKDVFDTDDDAFLQDFQQLLIKHDRSGNMMVHVTV